MHVRNGQGGRRWVLAFMWLKFTVMWRFFRLAALAAGVDPPENIRRCFANNYDIEVRTPAQALSLERTTAY